MAGQVRFRDHLGRDVAADVGKDAGCGFGRHVGDVLVFVDDEAVEQRAVEHPAFSRFAPVVEVAEVGEQVNDLVETLSGAGVGGGHHVEPCSDLVEADTDAFLLALEQVEWDCVGIVGLDEFEPFSFELLLLRFQEFAFVLAGGFELIEHLVQHLSHPISFCRGETVGAVGRFDVLLDPSGEDRGAGAGGALAAPAGAGEVLIPIPGLVAGSFDHELGAARAVQRALEVVVVLLGAFPTSVLRIELGLDAQPGLGVDQRRVGAIVGNAAEGDGALVVTVDKD
nr:hypothetical protein [Pseudoclavibacter helvolus]